MVDHPQRELSGHVERDRSKANGGYAVVRGLDPVAYGSVGDILAFAKENPMTGCIEQIALTRVDGEKVLPDTWYGVDLTERKVLEFV